MSTEVRRCRSCGEPAVVIAREWGETVLLGTIQTGRTPQKDWVCQECGVSFSHRTHLLRIVLGLSLVPMLLLCGPVGGVIAFAAEGKVEQLGFAVVSGTIGLILAAVCAYPFWVRWRSPVVPDAPIPPIRYGLVEPGRKCGCGGVAPCTKIVASRTNGIPTGVTHTYHCPHCNTEFAVESAWATILGLVAGGAFAAGGAYFMPSAWADGWLATLICGAVAVGAGLVALQSVWRLANRWRHPKLAIAVDPSG